MAKKFTKLFIGDVVHTVGLRVFKKLTTSGGDISVIGGRMFNDIITTEGLSLLTIQDEADIIEYATNHQAPIICELIVTYKLVPIWFKSDSIENGLYVIIIIDDDIDAKYVEFDGEIMFNELTGAYAFIKDQGEFGEWLLANTTVAE